MKKNFLIFLLIFLLVPISQAFGLNRSSSMKPITSGPIKIEADNIRLYLIQAGYPVPEFTLYEDTLAGMKEAFQPFNSNDRIDDDVDPTGIMAYADCDNKIVLRDYVALPKHTKTFLVNVILAHEMLHLVSGVLEFCSSSYNFSANIRDVEEGLVQQITVEQMVIYRFLTSRTVKIPAEVQVVYADLRANVNVLSALKTKSKQGSWAARNWRKQLFLTPPSKRDLFIQNS